jgi:hypothetical protein
VQFDPARLERLTPEQRELFEQMQAELRAVIEENPLQGLHFCREACEVPSCQARPKQHEFMAARTRIAAAFAGNRFGKTCANVAWAIIQHAPDDLLPARLKPFKREREDNLGPVTGRYLCPSQKAIETIVLPEMKKWMPRSILRGGGWDKAYSSQRQIIYFADGGRLEFYTYEQDPAVMVGASLDYVIYDEPPPQGHFNENLMRTVDRRGCHRFGLTGVNMKGGGIGWLKRDIYDRPHDPDITVVRGSIHDNPLLSADEIAFTLAQFPDEEREAREHGTLLHFGGMVYPKWRDYVVPAPPKSFVRGKDVVIGIDPGYRRAAFIWGLFDDRNRGLIFHEAYVEKGNVLDYVKAIRMGNSLWEVRDPQYVIDPYAGNQHGHVDANTVKDELGRQGIWCQNPKVMDKDAIVYGGVQQIWRRMKEGGFHVSEACRELTREAEEYRTEDRPDGIFQAVKERDHGIDAMRYLFTLRPWYPDFAALLKEEQYVPGTAPSAAWLAAQDGPEPDSGPMGHLS